MKEEYKDYNKNIELMEQEIDAGSTDRHKYRKLNFTVMKNTIDICRLDERLIDAIRTSLGGQHIYYETEPLSSNYEANPDQKVIVTDSRTFEAAKKYSGRKVAVLSFANSHSVGGAPFSAGAQEESLCRCSTLFPCIETAKDFYESHKRDFNLGKIDALGNDDMIYTPDVVVFKTDVSAPKIMEEDDWYKVDVITSAAPELMAYFGSTDNLEEVLRKRITRILDVAAANNVQVLILGAYGCGAFKNPPELVAKLFNELIGKYPFEVVEFAVIKGNKSPSNYDIFKGIITEK